MKKWIALVTVLTSLTYADAAPPIEEASRDVVEVADEAAPEMPARKQVGAAANEGSKSGSGAGKYVLAGSAVAAAIIACALLAGDKGHHHHHHHSHN